MVRKDKVYTFKAKTTGTTYHIPHVSLKDAQIRARNKWGQDVLISSGKINKSLTKNWLYWH